MLICSFLGFGTNSTTGFLGVGLGFSSLSTSTSMSMSMSFSLWTTTGLAVPSSGVLDAPSSHESSTVAEAPPPVSPANGSPVPSASANHKPPNGVNGERAWPRNAGARSNSTANTITHWSTFCPRRRQFRPRPPGRRYRTWRKTNRTTARTPPRSRSAWWASAANRWRSCRPRRSRPKSPAPPSRSWTCLLLSCGWASASHLLHRWRCENTAGFTASKNNRRGQNWNRGEKKNTNNVFCERERENLSNHEIRHEEWVRYNCSALTAHWRNKAPRARHSRSAANTASGSNGGRRGGGPRYHVRRVARVCQRRRDPVVNCSMDSTPVPPLTTNL